jgi:hypothetical protein
MDRHRFGASSAAASAFLLGLDGLSVRQAHGPQLARRDRVPVRIGFGGIEQALARHHDPAASDAR